MSSDHQLSSLLSQLDSSPTPHHVVGWWSEMLRTNGFTDQTRSLKLDAQQGFFCRGGSIVAWSQPRNCTTLGFRIVGAHTDSPGLHLKPLADKRFHNNNLLGVEIYGGPLLNSWLDRDLGIAGHVVLKDGSTHLFQSEIAVARISQLAIHLDRDVNEKGLVLDRHQHLNAMWNISDNAANYPQWIAEQIKISVNEMVASSSQLFDIQKASLIGRENEMLASARIDNQVSCWAAMTSLLSASVGDRPSIVALFDHEEVGSSSATGAAGPLLEHVLEQLVISQGGSRNEFIHTLRTSHCVSADNAHAVHHNYPERHDTNHAPLINQGVVVKSNIGQRYATSAETLQPFSAACEKANVPIQHFASRNNIACGSTIGPITSTRLGIDTIDVGVPQLSMHSAREVCGTKDPIFLRDALTAYFSR